MSPAGADGVGREPQAFSALGEAGMVVAHGHVSRPEQVFLGLVHGVVGVVQARRKIFVRPSSRPRVVVCGVGRARPDRIRRRPQRRRRRRPRPGPGDRGLGLVEDQLRAPSIGRANGQPAAPACADAEYARRRDRRGPRRIDDIQFTPDAVSVRRSSAASADDHLLSTGLSADTYSGRRTRRGQGPCAGPR